MGIHIRKAVPEDAHAYVLCNLACWRAAYRDIMPADYLESKAADVLQETEDYRVSLQKPGAYAYFCVECAGEMVGRLVVCHSRDLDKPTSGEVAAIYLLEAFWGKGHGRALMDFAVDVLRERGYTEAYLWVLEENSRARRFYERYGFTFDGRRGEVVYGKSLTVLRYVLPLK